MLLPQDAGVRQVSCGNAMHQAAVCLLLSEFCSADVVTLHCCYSISQVSAVVYFSLLRLMHAC